MKHKELRESVAGVARRLIASGLVTGTSGNVSARTPEGDALVTPTGLPYEALDPEHVVLVSLDGDHLEGEFESSSETPIPTPGEALRAAVRMTPEDELIVVTGSLYLVADVLRIPSIGGTSSSYDSSPPLEDNEENSSEFRPFARSLSDVT